MITQQEISLLIVDECHNTVRNTVYAQIMHNYLELKAAQVTKYQLAQVVGLTAMPEMGRKLGLKEVNTLVTLSAHMDATSGIRTVQKHAQELREFVRKPDGYEEQLYQSKQIELMEQLIQTTCLPTGQQLQEEIIHKQRLIREYAVKQRELEELRMNTHPAGDVEVQCKKCKIMACRGSDIYYINNTNHHVVPGTHFSSLYELIHHHTPGYVDGCDDPILKKDYKIHCSNCNQSWGIFGTSLNFEVPILKCESFNFLVKGQPKNFKQWKKRPFKTLPLSTWFSQTSPLEKNDAAAIHQGKH